MASARTLATVSLCAFLAWGCGRLADGNHRGPPLAVMTGTITEVERVPVQGDLSFALEWLPDAELTRLLDAAAAPGPTCPTLASPTPLCDGSPAQGGETCRWKADRVADRLQVLAHETSLYRFEFAVSDLPPRAARFDLARQGGAGTFALAAVVAFDDANRDGAFRLGRPGDPPEPALASSARPAAGQPRLSYLVAFLDGTIEPERIDPAYAEPLLFLPQGFSVWIEEEWLDGYGRSEDGARYWGPVGTPIELFLAPGATAACLEEEREVVYSLSMPDGSAPLWCSDDGFQATWSRTTTPGPCRVREERYSADYRCAGSPPPPWSCPARTTGSLRVAVATFGESPDADGYTVRVADRAARWVAPNGSVAIPALPPGSHDVALDGIAFNCAVMSRNPSTALVVAGKAAVLDLTVACGTTRQGTIRVRVSTTGADPDPDGYTVSVDGDLEGVVGPTGLVTLPDLEPGLRAVSLGGVAANCAVVGANPLQVALAPGATADAEFAVECAPRQGGAIRVQVATTGDDVDANGYTVSVDGNLSGVVGPTGVVTVTGVEPGLHAVTLGDLATNCAVLEANPIQASVALGTITIAPFDVLRVSTGPGNTTRLAVTTSTTGADLDDGYLLSVYGNQYRAEQLAIAPNQTLWLDLGPDPARQGSFSVYLYDVARNCSGGGTQTVWVVPGRWNEIQIGVQCFASGSLRVTATTTGVEPDPNGFEIALQGSSVNERFTVPANGSTTIPRLLPGEYQATLLGVAANCDAAQRTATSTVTAGATAEVAFGVSCAAATQLAYTQVVYATDDYGEPSLLFPPEIFVVHSNGAGATNLTNHPAADADPAWSPGGGRITFTSDRDGNREIYAMNADGSAVTRLTSHAAADYQPAWSPDGTRIAFVSERDGSAEIYAMAADGTNPTRLTVDGGASDPAWSPDGTRIAFVRTSGPVSTFIYVMNADGSDLVPLLGEVGPRRDVEPDWSPDGSAIAFVRSPCGDFDETGYPYCLIGWLEEVRWTLADGTGGGVALGGDVHRGRSVPSWSPDARQIAFGDFRPVFDFYGSEIRVVRTDGVGEAVLVVDEGSQPAWSR